MKGALAVVLCALAVVHGRSTSLQTVVPSTSVASLGDNPWVVHLRIAVGTSGFLNTCTGTLIDSGWVLTAASCLVNTRFIWIRYGLVTVVNPELVTEASGGIQHPNFNANTLSNNIGIISTNRAVETTHNIHPIRLEADDANLPSSGFFCSFSDNNNTPGETLSCADLSLRTTVSGDLASSTATSVFDLGAGLVSDGVQVGILGSSGSGSVFIRVGRYIQWLNTITGLSLGSRGAAHDVILN